LFITSHHASPPGVTRPEDEPITFLHILAVNDREDVRGEHRPLT
jgi:hypothetical protein